MPERKGELKATFLEILRRTGNVSRAAHDAGIANRTAYSWREKDEEFAKDWHEAEQAALDELEEVLRARAVFGSDRPVFYKGDIVGHVTEYSDSNGQFLLQVKRYPTKRVEMTGANGEPLNMAPSQLVVNFVKPGQIELRKKPKTEPEQE